MTIRFLSLIVFLFLSGISSVSHSAQEFSVDDGQSVNANISTSELTRIAVKGGKIDRVWGAAGVIDVQPDKERGEIYIRPLPSAPKVFSFFVRDSAGGTYTVVANRSNIPAESILLISNNRFINEKSNERYRALPFVNQLKALMKTMATGENPEGFYSEKTDTVVPLWMETKIRLIKIYATEKLYGEVYRVENLTPEQIVFHEREFLEFGDRVKAVALDSLAIPPGRATHLYVVRLKKEDSK